MKLQFDPLDVQATLDEIKRVKREIIEGDIKLDDGSVFQADRDSMEAMQLVADGLEEDEVADWRLSNNTTVPLDHSQIWNIREDIIMAKSKRLLVIDSQYLSMKNSNPTKRDLEDWKALHNV